MTGTAAAAAVQVAAMAAPGPTGALFDVVLLLHVAAALVALATVAASGLASARLLGARRRPPAAGVLGYFVPGVNWAGRTLHAVPLLGLALVGLSRGAYRFDEPWVVAGIGLWAAAAGLAEGVLWPVERRVQAALVGVAPAGLAAVRSDGPGATAGVPSTLPGAVPPACARLCARLCASAAAIGALLIAAMVVMVARP